MGVRRGLFVTASLLAAFAAAIGAAPAAEAAASYPATINTDHPYAYWQLAEAPGATVAVDSSGHSRAGTLASCVVLGKPGPIVNDSATAAVMGKKPGCYMTYKNTTGYSGDYSVEAWIKPLTNTKDTMTFLDSRSVDTANGSGEYGFDFKLTGTDNAGGRQLCVDVGDGAEWMLNGCVPFFFAVGRWYYVAMTVSQETGTVVAYANKDHADGPLATFGRKPLLLNARHPFTIGGNPRYDGPTDLSENFNGIVGQVAVYRYALTGAQALAHQQAGKAA